MTRCLDGARASQIDIKILAGATMATGGTQSNWKIGERRKAMRREATLSQFRGRFATVESLKARNGGVAALPCL